MGVHVAYVVPGSAAPVHGDHLATTLGYHTLGTYVLARQRQYPELAHLVAHGWLDEGDPGSLQRLEREVTQLQKAVSAGDPDTASVAAHLLTALRAQPQGTTGVIVTDGEPAGDDTMQDDQ
jgi:hypothetical protein